MKIDKKLKCCRKMAGLTQLELSQKMGNKDKTPVTKLESGRDASLEMIAKIASILKIKVWDLLDDDDIQKLEPYFCMDKEDGCLDRELIPVYLYNEEVSEFNNNDLLLDYVSCPQFLKNDKNVFGIFKTLSKSKSVVYFFEAYTDIQFNNLALVIYDRHLYIADIYEENIGDYILQTTDLDEVFINDLNKLKHIGKLCAKLIIE
ncbi:helix-turn-helix transcriptional regulator [Faecalitalea cylindroides]|uniref:helix-turn-helix transcriptional regulator n=1 Tax=Faecalitalea cylindroides TaxID=39483 RepID=UPI0022E72AC1|nr:helix-turn-helix transcriptional regulator [Faecalitalea cylindroides]